MQVCTRWSSTYMMLKRLLELRKHVTFVISRAKDQKMRDKALTPQEWKDVQQLVLLLGPFAEAVRHWEGQHYVTISIVWPIVSVLFDFILGKREGRENLTDWTTFSPSVLAVRSKLFSLMQQQKYFENITPLMAIATILDPRFKNLPFAVNRLNAQEWARAIVQDAMNHLPEPPAPAPRPAAAAAAAASNAANAGPALNIFGNEAPSTENELASYLSAPQANRQVNPLDWWKTQQTVYPRLAKLAKRYLATPASSAPSERVFSSMNIVISKTRSRLLPERSEALIFLKYNRQLLMLYNGTRTPCPFCKE